MFRGASLCAAVPHKGASERPWIHAAFRPCGTRADLVATNVALKPEQSRTPRTTPSTRFCNRAFPPEGEVSNHKGIFDERIPFRRNVRARSFAEHE